MNNHVKTRFRIPHLTTAMRAKCLGSCLNPWNVVSIALADARLTAQQVHSALFTARVPLELRIVRRYFSVTLTFEPSERAWSPSPGSCIWFGQK